MDIVWSNLWVAFFGSSAGAGVIVFFDFMIRRYNKKVNNFNSAISVQLSLNLMLIELLQYKDLDEESKNDSLKYCKNSSDPEGFWRDHRHTLLERKLSTYDIIDLNWDFTQYLSRNTHGARKMLKDLIPARACYQCVLSLIQKRNVIYDKLIQNHKFTGEVINEKYISRDDKDFEANEKRLLLELKSVTDLYFDRFDGMVIAIYDAFNKMSQYIDKEFPGYDPLELEVSKDKMEILEKMSKDKTVHASM